MNKKIPLFLVLNVESHRTPEENLGIYYLQAALKASGTDSDYRDLWLENMSTKNFIEKYDFSGMLFIGVSGCLSNLAEISELIRLLHGKVPVVMGGYKKSRATRIC
ncbi:hypothetical protein [Lactococcus lactis]